jgi:fructokinase
LQIVSIGEVLWDVFDDRKEFLGGAPLNFAANAQRLGNPVVLLTGVGADARGTRALETMHALGLTTEMVQVVSERATGTAIIVKDSTGNADFVIDRPAAFDRLHVGDSHLARLQKFNPDWVYYGTLAQTDPPAEEILRQILQRSPQAKRFYDMNLRTGHWNLPLVQRLLKLANALKLNEAEAKLLFQKTLEPTEFNLEEFCKSYSSTYELEVICITLGSKGCAVFVDEKLFTFTGFSVKVVDTVGAGDAFAAAFLHGLNAGWPMSRIATFANALGALVASRTGATPDWTLDECLQLTESSAGAGHFVFTRN